jgi:rfaE bifunctional protein kinase chain/domain
MTPSRFDQITSRYTGLRVAVLGDFCLDRYLEIDPLKEEVSIETGLAVYNVVNVRAQPGGAGTILNNFSALGAGAIYPIGFAGEDGEGFELRRALEQRPGVRLDYFVPTAQARTFTYCKPLIRSPGKAPVELNRLDSKNWVTTPAQLQDQLIDHLRKAGKNVDAIIVLDQVDLPETGVVTRSLLASLGALAEQNPSLLILADSRRGLRGFPHVVFKMNATELAAFSETKQQLTLEEVKAQAQKLARANGRHVFVTLAEQGIVGAGPGGEIEHVQALALRGEIDIVGAGDAVSANLSSALAARATLREALDLANAAASVVIHKLGTTGTASIAELASLLLPGGG